jgi:hypothetical protein
MKHRNILGEMILIIPKKKKKKEDNLASKAETFSQKFKSDCTKTRNIYDTIEKLEALQTQSNWKFTLFRVGGVLDDASSLSCLSSLGSWFRCRSFNRSRESRGPGEASRSAFECSLTREEGDSRASRSRSSRRSFLVGVLMVRQVH